MIDFLLQVCCETWGILKEASVFLLFGFLLAGRACGPRPQGRCSGSSAPARSSRCSGRRRSACRCRCAPAAWCRPRSDYAARAHPGRNRCLPHRHARDRGRFHQPELCADGSDHHRFPSARRRWSPPSPPGFATNFFGVARGNRRRRCSIPPVPQTRAADCCRRCCADDGDHHDHSHDHGLDHGHGTATITAMTTAMTTATTTRTGLDASRGWAVAASAAERSASTATHFANSWTRPATGWCSASCLSGVVAAALPPDLLRAVPGRRLRLDAGHAADRHPDLHLRLLLDAGGRGAGDEGPQSGRRPGLPARRAGHQPRQPGRAAEVPGRARRRRSISPRSSS